MSQPPCCTEAGCPEPATWRIIVPEAVSRVDPDLRVRRGREFLCDGHTAALRQAMVALGCEPARVATVLRPLAPRVRRPLRLVTPQERGGGGEGEPQEEEEEEEEEHE